MNTIPWLRAVALLEGSSLLLLLFVAMPLKYFAGMPRAVQIAGPVHGVLFLAFVAVLFQITLERRWPISRVLLAFVASIVPFGAFLFDRTLRRES